MVRRLANVEKKAWADKNKITGSDDPEAAAAEVDEDGGAVDIPTHLMSSPTTVYTKFFDSFGKNIKLGVIEDSPNRSKLAKLLRWKSTVSLEGAKTNTSSIYRSLEDYVAAMKPGQKQIYFIAGESVEVLQMSPFLEKLTSRGLEVFLLVDPIDEYVIQNLPEFEGKRLQSITKEGLQLPDDGGVAKRLEEAYKKEFKALTEVLKKVLGDKVEKVTVSSRLDTTPCVLVTSQFGYSANMERIMKSQAFANVDKGQALLAKKTLEVNPRHPIIVALKERANVDAEATGAAADVADIARLLYEAALLNSGFSLEDTRAFAGRVSRMVGSAMKLESLDLVPEITLPAKEEESAPSSSSAEGGASASDAEEDL